MSRLVLALLLVLAACASPSTTRDPRWCYVAAPEQGPPSGICTLGGEPMCERSRADVARQGVTTSACTPLDRP